MIENPATDNFNMEGKIGLYGYQPSPVNDRAFLITKENQVIGDYTVLDKEEELSLSEKKVMNLVALLNERKNLMDLGSGSDSRTLYNVVNKKDEQGKSKIIFNILKKSGVSSENALLYIDYDERLFHEHIS